MKPRAQLAAVLISLFATSASAQVTYGGYNLGPDYGAMIQQQLQQQQQMNAQMQQVQRSVVQQAMQSPDCQAKYREFLVRGGNLPYAQFAYQYAATGGFSAEGLQRFRQSEATNQQREMSAYQGMRNAEYQRGQAQQDFADGYARNLDQAGQNLQGNSTWVDPQTGEQRRLSYIGQNTFQDSQSGRVYYRNDAGQYFVRGGDGQWYPMQAAQ